MENYSNLKILDENIILLCSPIKHTFESPSILPTLGILHLTQGMNRKEKKLTEMVFHT